MTTQERKQYIYNAMLNVVKSDDDLLVEIAEELDDYNGFLGDDRCYYMGDIDELLEGRKPSEILDMVTDDFNLNDEFFYFTYKGIESCNNKAMHYTDCYSEEEILDNYLTDSYRYNVNNDDFEELARIYDEYTDDDTEEETDDEFTERIDALSE